MLNSRKAAQAKFGRMLRWHALAFDTNRRWNPAMVLQPAPDQRDWPAARDRARREQIGSARMVLSGHEPEAPLAPSLLRRLSSLPEAPLLAPEAPVLAPRAAPVLVFEAPFLAPPRPAGRRAVE